MNAELWQRLKLLYNVALDLPIEGRLAFVEAACDGDPELLSELRALVAAEQSTDFDLRPPLSRLLPEVVSTLPLEPGTFLAGRFRILRHLGSGGMGDVYEASDQQLEDGRIALKTIHPSIADNPVALARFKDEVRLARRVTGSNVCRIHELYLTASDRNTHVTAFLTMEMLEGVTLHERIAQVGSLSLPEIRSIADQLCAGLCCIHDAGIIHQDLKPRNVMLVPQDGGERVVVTDFGLARATLRTPPADEDASTERLPVAGTPSYMAPEQFEGREVGPPTDIYALGLILYELATGVQPYAAHTPLAAASRRSKPPAFASSLRAELPPAWDDVIACCLRYEPEQRFQSASEVAAALKRTRKIVIRTWGHRLTIPLPFIFALGAVALLCLLALSWLAYRRATERRLAPEAAHWYGMGMAALREGSYLKATRLLTMVTERDPTYALAHAALADAWTELDFTDNAQREMLLASAPNEQRGLNEQERRYIDAVRNTLVRDYSSAAQDYEEILHRLPKEGKAQGYVDLGRIYEKAGKVPDTLASYEQAAKLSADDPAPFLHLGVLRSRLRDKAGAATAFSKAEELYNAESNLEGLAEVAYQRGYAANDEEDNAAATHYLNQSLAIARQIPSVQLEVRSLAQLSSIAYNSNKDDEAITQASEVISTAREKGLEYWITDGLVRLGNAQLDKGDYTGAEASLREALSRAKDGMHPRLEATASFSLASLRSQQQRWDEVLLYAKPALTYFQDYGFADLTDQSLVLMTRAHRGLGHYTTALATGSQLLKNAEASHRQAYVLLAEKTIGFTLFRLQQLPQALPHFDHAIQVANSLHQDDVYAQIARADLLWQLGRYEEASSALSDVAQTDGKRSDISSAMALIRAEMLVSRGDPKAGLDVVRQARVAFPDLGKNPSLNSSFVRTAVQGELALGQTKAAHAAALSLPEPQATADQWENAENELTRATVCLRSGDDTGARAHAQNAESFFAQNNLRESNALSTLTLAQAAAALGDRANADMWSKKTVDIFRTLEQSWGAPTFRQYIARPDRQQDLHALAALRYTHGDVIDDPRPSNP